MADFRQNPVTGQWVIVSEERGDRPQELQWQATASELVGGCPFCEGHESVTPGEVLAYRRPDSRRDGPGWRVRVIPNKFPAVADGAGLHEVIIESPRHLTSVAQLEAAEFAGVVEVYRERLAMLKASGRFREALLFKNSGPSAGATLAHLHSQLVAASRDTPVELLGSRAARLRDQFNASRECTVCRMLADERERGGRIVAETPGFTAFCPYAARFPYETWIVPRGHAPHFGQSSPQSLPEFAGLLRAVLVKLERILKVAAYNYIVHTAPFDIDSDNHYHWHLEILPRITTIAGFELAARCFINPTSPDRAAAQLRET